MGDSGSLSLGFILGFLSVKLCMDTPRMDYDSHRIVWAWSLLTVPCFDVVRVFFFRIIHGRSPFQPDKITFIISSWLADSVSIRLWSRLLSCSY